VHVNHKQIDYTAHLCRVLLILLTLLSLKKTINFRYGPKKAFIIDMGRKGFTEVGLAVNNPSVNKPFTEGVRGYAINRGSPNGFVAKGYVAK
jgi:hypothetical protein